MAKENWIQNAIKKPGALKKTAAEHEGLTKSGKIKKTFLKEAEKGELGKKAEKRANLAETLGKLSGSKKKK